MKLQATSLDDGDSTRKKVKQARRQVWEVQKRTATMLAREIADSIAHAQSIERDSSYNLPPWSDLGVQHDVSKINSLAAAHKAYGEVLELLDDILIRKA